MHLPSVYSSFGKSWFLMYILSIPKHIAQVKGSGGKNFFEAFRRPIKMKNERDPRPSILVFLLQRQSGAYGPF